MDMPDAFDKLDETKQSVGGSGDYAPWWADGDDFDVEEGDQLIGVCVEKHKYNDPGNNDHPVATIRSTGGDSSVEEGVEASTPTRKGIEPFAENVQIGDLVLIEYTGQVGTDSGRDMHTYNASSVSQEEWEETDDAEHIREVWEASDHYVEGN